MLRWSRYTIRIQVLGEEICIYPINSFSSEFIIKFVRRVKPRPINGRQASIWLNYTTRIQILGEKSGIHQTVPFHPSKGELNSINYCILNGNDQAIQSVFKYSGKKEESPNYSFFIWLLLKWDYSRFWLRKRFGTNQAKCHQRWRALELDRAIKF